MKPTKPYIYENIEEDFQVPYKYFGKFDAENFKHRYRSLTNTPKRIYHKRYTVEQW